jgi:hypothetical protein
MTKAALPAEEEPADTRFLLEMLTTSPARS